MTQREIKFRAWDEQSKTMHIPMTLRQMKKVLVKGTIGEVGSMGAVFSFTFDELVLSQFTGLLDKNGKEIYEGDLLKYSLDAVDSRGENPEPTEYVEEVHFKDGCFDLDGCPVYVANTIGEVVGNIYENPEL